MTETPGGPHVDPKKQTKTNGSPESWDESPNCPQDLCLDPPLTRSFTAVTGQVFQTFLSGPPMAMLWCLAPVTHRWLAVSRLYYCVSPLRLTIFRGIVFIKGWLLLSLTKSAIRGLSKDETLNCRQLKPSLKHPAFRGIALLHVCRESATRGNHQLLSINRSITHSRLGNNN